ncbi:hypothetical protein BDV25DRAFT_168986 [Aspergillus avenaceus]|uniref:LipA and NB-ARC domain protein n=1 Tax=Aspergillus avenaceus TaxID=36643 RepID=A0A5N6U4J3_ASPAV|nr:hypothetical protein BDV25DRAFT_168986 [Aspergillus avenaceus]
MSFNQPIRRKPVPLGPSPQETGVIRPITPTSPRPTTSFKQPILQESINSTPSSSYLRPPLSHSHTAHTIPRYRSTPDLRGSAQPLPRAATDFPAPTEQPNSPNAFQKAYGEVSHFLGGLIAHPTQSNRHFTILRHSPGIVFYRGSTTSVTVSVFSDSPLPADRSYWLQNRGWSGNTGMKAKAFFRFTDDWVNVTPSFALGAEQVGPADERAWQRDIGKFRKKAPVKLQGHRLRETVVARIPAEVNDGYFQLNLCQGPKKKVLCSSPVFRVLSTSMDPSSMRGASLATMPLEVGAMVLGMYAQKVTQTVRAPVSAAVSNRVDKYKPSGVKLTAAQTAYSASGVEESVNRLRNGRNHVDGPDRQQQTREYQQAALDSGPQPPFPMDFKARAQSTNTPGIETPRYSLSKVPDSVLDTLRGHFIAWTRIEGDQKRPSTSHAPSPGPHNFPIPPHTPPPPYPGTLSPHNESSTWYPSILSITLLDPTHQTRINLSTAMTRVATLRFLDEVSTPPSKVEIRVMAFLRPETQLPPPSGMTEKDLHVARATAAEAEMLADIYDASYAQNTLDHPAWRPELNDRQGTWFDRAKEGVENVRGRAEKMIENVPLHWVGVRSATAEMKDRQVEVNGFYIVR